MPSGTVHEKRLTIRMGCWSMGGDDNNNVSREKWKASNDCSGRRAGFL